MSDDNLYPLNLGNTIEPSATLQAWGYRRDLREEQKIELDRRYEQIKTIVLGRSQNGSSHSSRKPSGN